MNISVFVTSYNQKDYLVEAVESVLAQTLRPHQIVIVDDCSQDGSQEVIAGFASRFPDLVLPIYHATNQGVSRTRIDALRAVTGDHVTYVDGDDRYLPAKLEKEACLLGEKPDAQIACSNSYYMTAKGARTGTWVTKSKPPEGDVFWQTYARDLPRRNLFRMELVRYSAWQRLGFHDPRLRIYEDWDMRIRLTKRCRLAYHDEPLSEIRIHGTGLSGARAGEHLAALDYIRSKNSVLLDDLNAEQRDSVEKGLDSWKAKLIRRAAREILADGVPQTDLPHRPNRRAQALRLYLQSLAYRPDGPDARLLLQILLPGRAYDLLRTWSRPKSWQGRVNDEH